jgi:signal transduction histidine kinase
VLALFGLALVVTLVGLGRIGDAEREVARLDHAKHAGHQAAALAREQYIHQAHTLLEWNGSHLGHYGEIATEARHATEHLYALADTDATRREADAIARLVADSDRIFRDEVVPAVLRNDRSRIGELHRTTEAIVERVVQRNEALNSVLEARADRARMRADDLRDQVRPVVVACFALAILLATAVGFYLFRSISRPIAALRAGAQRVGAGDLASRIAITGKDELAELARTFDQMTGDLARNQQALVEASRLASIGQVASGVAHEINNPLGVIIGYLRILRATPDLGGREELQIIEDEVQQCQRIVAGLLDLARPVTLQLATVDLGEVVREAVERLEETGSVAGVRIEIGGTPQRLPVCADEARLRQIVVNLVANAVDAAREERATAAEVRVGWHRDRDRVWLEVTDRGPGIPAEVTSRLFEPFVSTKARGHGLGLALARSLARAHQGDVEIGPAARDGTRAAVWLPHRLEEART